MTSQGALPQLDLGGGPSESECYTCWTPLAPGQAYYRLRVGLDHAPNFHAVAPEHASTVEEETVFCVCEHCYEDVTAQVDTLLDWLWNRRPAQQPHLESAIETDGSKGRHLTGVNLFDTSEDVRRATVLGCGAEREDS